MLTLLLSLPAGGCSMMEAPPTAEAREKTGTDAAPKTRQRQGPEIVIRTQAGARHAVSVEVARTPRARQQGLMHRDSLADGHGMLFIMPSIRASRSAAQCEDGTGVSGYSADPSAVG